MPQVSAKVMGGALQLINAETVGDLKAKLGVQNHVANLNGDTVSDDQDLNEGDFVTFAPAVKGGC
jgi:sulfur carrier protein ThiS